MVRLIGLILVALSLSWLMPGGLVTGAPVVTPAADSCGDECLCTQLLGHCECEVQAPKRAPAPQVPLRTVSELRLIPLPLNAPPLIVPARAIPIRIGITPCRVMACDGVRPQARLCSWQT